MLFYDWGWRTHSPLPFRNSFDFKRNTQSRHINIVMIMTYVIHAYCCRIFIAEYKLTTECHLYAEFFVHHFDFIAPTSGMYEMRLLHLATTGIRGTNGFFRTNGGKKVSSYSHMYVVVFFRDSM